MNDLATATAPRTPFLTDLDDRARIRGSRDPLGFMSVWVWFGRKIIGNLTTNTDSVRGFTTLLLGLHFARLIQELKGREVESTLALFLKLEQLAGYARWTIGNDGDFRGVETVKRNIAERGPIHLSASPRDQILSNQKIYGLWGLYTVAARRSGLVLGDAAQLTPDAADFVERTYVGDVLASAGLRDVRAITDLIATERPEVDLTGRHGQIMRSVAQVLGPALRPDEITFYGDHLLRSGPQSSTDGRQEMLTDLVVRLPKDQPLSPGIVRSLASEAARRGELGQALANWLVRIVHCESVLAPTAGVFEFLQSRDRARVDEVASELRGAWGKGLTTIDLDAVRSLSADLTAAQGDPVFTSRLLEIAEALVGGEWSRTIRLLLQHNGAIMQARLGSAPWIQESQDRLDVRYREDPSNLPGVDEIPELWSNPYFIESLRSIAYELAGPARAS